MLVQAAETRTTNSNRLGRLGPYKGTVCKTDATRLPVVYTTLAVETFGRKSVICGEMSKLLGILLAPLVALSLTSCALRPDSQTGTVSGHVMIRACGGAPSCHPGAAQGAVVMFSRSGQPTAATVDENGRYHIELPGGSYGVIVGFVGAGLPNGGGWVTRFTGPTQLTVIAGKTVTADFDGTRQLS